MDGHERTTPPDQGDPVAVTSGFHDFLRETLAWKCEGLSEEELRRAGTPSGVSLLAIIQHSAWVERYWFRYIFAGEEMPALAHPDADWELDPAVPATAVLADYRAAWDESRAIVSGHGWTDLAARTQRDGSTRSLGWILSHMIEEVARHCGHADILREAIDGATGE